LIAFDEEGERQRHIVAAVVLIGDAHLDVDAVREYCRTGLPAYKVPHRIVQVHEQTHPRPLISGQSRPAGLDIAMRPSSEWPQFSGHLNWGFTRA